MHAILLSIHYVCIAFHFVEIPQHCSSAQIRMSRPNDNSGLPRMMSASVPTIFNVQPSSSTDYENASSVIHWSVYYRYRKVGTLQMFTGVYRVIKGFFCNICRENPVIFTYCKEIPADIAGLPCIYCRKTP